MPRGSSNLLGETHEIDTIRTRASSPINYKTAKKSIPIKAIMDVFKEMATKFAPCRNGWIWKLQRYAANCPTTVAHLRKFTEHFVNGLLPKPLWTFLSVASIILFHKLSQAKRDQLDLLNPKLRPVTIARSPPNKILMKMRQKNEKE